MTAYTLKVRQRVGGIFTEKKPLDSARGSVSGDSSRRGPAAAPSEAGKQNPRGSVVAQEGPKQKQRPSIMIDEQPKGRRRSVFGGGKQARGSGSGKTGAAAKVGTTPTSGVVGTEVAQSFASLRSRT
jgi:hypothetical protein